MKRIIAINGSNHRDGNTAFLLKKCLEPIKGFETELINLVDYGIKNCDGCNRCVKGEECPIEDETSKILEKMASADAIILGSPSHGANISVLMKTLFDRARPLRMSGFKLRDRYISFIVVGGLRNGGQEGAVGVMIQFALYHGAIVFGIVDDPVSQGPFAIGTLQSVDGTFNPISKDRIGINSAIRLGRRITELLG